LRREEVPRDDAGGEERKKEELRKQLVRNSYFPKPAEGGAGICRTSERRSRGKCRG
jgi:hypothetical protein